MNLVSHALVTSRPQPVVASVEPMLYLTFLLGEEAYAIGILSIMEIIEYGGVTPVPLMPTAIRGVINLRGAVVPVLDLAVRFGRAPVVPARRTCIVIVEVGAEDHRQVLGMVVDAVNAVQEIAEGDIEPVPSFGLRIASDFVSGIGKVSGRFVILLNVEQVLSVVELAALAPPDPLGALEGPR